jgi:hypothetical protein
LRSFQIRNEQFFFAPLRYAQSPQAGPRFRKIKEVKGLSASGGVARRRTHGTSHKQPRRLTLRFIRLRRIAEKGHFWTETAISRVQMAPAVIAKRLPPARSQ